MKWMVDCNGNEGDGGETAIQDVVKDLDFAALIEKQGALAAMVQNAIESADYHITDRGGGGGKWHIGVPFDDLSVAVDYLSYMTRIFHKAIGVGLLRFSLKTWSREHWLDSSR